MTIVTPYLTFPRISWWAMVANADKVIFDAAEHFQKMTDRNKYQVSGANNVIKLSVPLAGGRNQRVAMSEVCIDNCTNWQIQHWRAIVSAYRRTPYFEHYEASLQALFESQFTQLVDFNRVAYQWVKKQLKLTYEEAEAEAFSKTYPPEVKDLRFLKTVSPQLPLYYQVFEDRVGFQNDLSILDLLFSEGPGTVAYLRSVGL